jgi:hypothetical protein
MATSSTDSFDNVGFDMDTFLVYLAAHLLGPSTLQQAASNGQPFDISWRSPVLRNMSHQGIEENATIEAPWNDTTTSTSTARRTSDRESHLLIHGLVLVDLRFDFFADGSISLRPQTLWQQQQQHSNISTTAATNDSKNCSIDYHYYIGKTVTKETLERHFESLQIDVHHTPAPLLAKSMAEAWHRVNTVTLPTKNSFSSLYLKLDYTIREIVLGAPMTVWDENDGGNGSGKKLHIPHEFAHITCQHLGHVIPKDTKNQTPLDIELLDVFHHITKTWRTVVRTATENSKIVPGRIPDTVEATSTASTVPDSSSSLVKTKEWKEVRVSRRGKGAGFGRKRKL